MFLLIELFVVVVLFKQGHIDENRCPNQHQLVVDRARSTGFTIIFRKGHVIGVSPKAQLVGQSRPQLGDLGILLSIRRNRRIDGFSRDWIPDQKGQPTTLALPAAAAGHHAQPTPARVGPQQIFGAGVLVQDHEFGDKDAAVTDIPCFSQIPSLGVFGSQIRQMPGSAAAAGRAGIFFFVDRDDVRAQLGRLQKGTGRSGLNDATVAVLGSQRHRRRTRVVDKSGFPASGGVAAKSLEKGGFLVDPSADAGKLKGVRGIAASIRAIGIGFQIVIRRIQQDPVDGGRATALAETELGGLGHHEFVQFS